MSNIKIALVCVSRGTLFSKTMESILQGLKGRDFEVFMQHGVSLPNCYNFAMKEVMESDCTHVWFVEEDNCFPNDTLQKMLDMDEDVVGTAYADRRSGENLVQHQKNGEVIMCGMGCMLVKMDVFRNLEAPYFREVFMRMDTDNEGVITLTPLLNIKVNGYGGQDIYFCAEVIKKGYKIKLLENGRVGHMMLVEPGKDMVNNGKHIITTRYLPVDDNGNEVQYNYVLSKTV